VRMRAGQREESFEHGFPDSLARPDLNTLVPLPWEEDVVACLVDLEDPVTHQPHPLDSRGALKRVLAEFAQFGLYPVVGPELEFYLCEPDPDRPGRYRPYAGHDSAVYTVGDLADPNGTLARLLDAAVELELGAIAAAHEYGRSQFEINLRHSEALDSADRAFRFRAMIEEIAAHEGLLATFMGKPFNGDEGSGFHLHISLVDAEGANAGEDADGTHGLTPVMRYFIAGMMVHGRALMVFFNPTVNAYRRISAEALVPTRVCWGHDQRMALVRVPNERGSSTRLELRLGDGRPIRTSPTPVRWPPASTASAASSSPPSQWRGCSTWTRNCWASRCRPRSPRRSRRSGTIR